MLHAVDYVHFVRGAEIHQVLLARIALNALYNSKEYPLDLSELGALFGSHRTMALGFLAWLPFASPPERRWSLEETSELRAIVRRSSKRGATDTSGAM